MTYLEKKEAQLEIVSFIIDGLCNCDCTDNGWKYLTKVRNNLISDIANYE